MLCAITVSAAYVYYLAVDADDAIPPAAADSIAHPPVIRAAALTQPLRHIPDPATPAAAADTIADPHSIARELQTALARAHCYDGPISGKWTAASQQAMDAFLALVNAQLSVGEARLDLLALVESNSAARCARPGTSPISASVDTQPALQPSPVYGDDGRSMLDRHWAQPGMLVPSHDMRASAVAEAPIATSSIEPATAEPGTEQPLPITASAATAAAPVAAAARINTASRENTPLQFEGGRVIAETKPDPLPAPQPVTTDAAAIPASTPAPVKAAQRKAKSAKRRVRSNDGPFEMSFDSIQKSISSLFD